MKKNLFVLIVAVMLTMVGCGSKPTLAKWVESDEIAAGEEEINALYDDSGLGFHVQFSADGEDVLVFSLIHDEYQQLAGRSQSEIDADFAMELDTLGMASNVSNFFEKCKEDTGITLKCVRVQCVNTDGTVIYSQEYLDTKE